MNKDEFNLLGLAFQAEIDSAMNKSRPYVMQTRHKRLAEKLVNEGLLKEVTVTMGSSPPIKVRGYQLTPEGHFTYCTNC